MKRYCVALLLLIVVGGTLGNDVPLSAQEPLRSSSSVFQLKTFQDDLGTHKYSLFLPQGYHSRKKWPVVLFLHGAGERGKDGVRPTRVGLGAALQAHPERYPFIAVFPQAEDEEKRYLESWLADGADGQRAMRILDSVIKEYSVDSEKQILTGWSMGGYGAWSLAAADPSRWLSVVPLCGGGKPEWAENLKEVPVWAFHGERDSVVLPASTEAMAAAFKGLDSQFSYTRIENAAHDIWRNTYGNSALMEWMLDPQTERADLSKAVPTVEPLRGPFKPALVMNRVAKVRLGNDAFAALSYAIPQYIPQNVLSGSLSNIHTSNNVRGYSFGIVFSGVNYSAQFHRGIVRATGDNRLLVQLGLSNVRLNLGQTRVSGSGRSAVTGPITVQLGTREPVWLNVAVVPYLENGRIRFQSRGASFKIDRGNMRVSPPAGVRVSGFGMTRSAVSEGLVSGLYNSRDRIEREVLQIVPNIIRQVEERLDITSLLEDTTGVWPLPVYAPRIRLKPSSVSVDNNGVTLGLDVTVAAFDEFKAPAVPRQVTMEDDIVLEPGTGLGLAVSTDVVTEVMQMMINEEITHINVLDMPGNAFDPWASRALWEQVYPEMKQWPSDLEIKTDLSLNKPLKVLSVTHPEDQAVPAEEDKSDSSEEGNSSETQNKVMSQTDQIEVELPELALKLSVLEEEEWKVKAEYNLDLVMALAFGLEKPDHSSRELDMQIEEVPQVKLTGAKFSDSPQNQVEESTALMLQSEFGESLFEWMRVTTDATMDLPLLQFDGAGLQVNGIELEKNQFSLKLETPEILITNESEVRQSYSTKGPYSGWSRPWSLEPGKSHRFKVAYPMEYRRNSGSIREYYALPAGTHVELRDKDETGEVRLYTVAP